MGLLLRCLAEAHADLEGGGARLLWPPQGPILAVVEELGGVVEHAALAREAHPTLRLLLLLLKLLKVADLLVD